MGRGAPIASYSGNVAFRALLHQRKSDYASTRSRRAKQAIAKEVYAEMEQRNGRFLQRLPLTKKESLSSEAGPQVWHVIDQRVALQKIQQTLRKKVKPVTSSPQESPPMLLPALIVPSPSPSVRPVRLSASSGLSFTSTQRSTADGSNGCNRGHYEPCVGLDSRAVINDLQTESFVAPPPIPIATKHRTGNTALGMPLSQGKDNRNHRVGNQGDFLTMLQDEMTTLCCKRQKISRQHHQLKVQYQIVIVQTTIS